MGLDYYLLVHFAARLSLQHYSDLKQNLFIQRTIAFFLLIVFTISMAPKTYFHGLLAGHKDISYCSEVHKASSCLHQQGIQCHFDDLVVSSAYTLQFNPIVFTPEVIYTSFFGLYKRNILRETATVKNVRGSPVADFS
jgi:hypothetical protein